MGLDVVEMVMEVEAQFGLSIPDADAARLVTVGDLYWYVREHAPGLPPRAEGAGASDPVWERLLDVLERETGVERHRLRADARFVEDLGMD